MKKTLVVCLIMLAVPTLSMADIHYNDGFTYVIENTINEPVRVDYEVPGVSTKVILKDGGYINNFLYTYEDSLFDIVGGVLVYDCLSYGNSEVSFSGGLIGNGLYAFDNSKISLRGGENYGSMRAYGNSQVTFSGGVIGNYIAVNENSQITISGSNFAINDTPVGFGQYFAADFASGHITGILQNGDTLSNNFNITYDASIILIPEPTTLALLGLGGLALTKRKS